MPKSLKARVSARLRPHGVMPRRLGRGRWQLAVALRQIRSSISISPKVLSQLRRFFSAVTPGMLCLKLLSHTLLGVTAPLAESRCAEFAQLLNEQGFDLALRIVPSLPSLSATIALRRSKSSGCLRRYSRSLVSGWLSDFSFLVMPSINETPSQKHRTFPSYLTHFQSHPRKGEEKICSSRLHSVGLA